MRIFITHIGPKETVTKYHIPAAPVYFSYNLIEGGAFDKVYSILPANIVGYRNDFNDEQVEVVYSSWRGKYLLHRFAPFLEQIMVFRKIPKHSTVWFYNINMLTVLLVMFLDLFRPSIERYTIMLDYTPGTKWNRLFWSKLINSSKGIICLSSTKDYKVKNSIVLPGVVPAGPSYAKVGLPIARNFMLSGNLNEHICMLHMVLPAFAQMPEYNLHITGFCGDEKYIKDFASQYPNIKWYGMLDYEIFQDVLHKCPFLLSTRDPKSPQNKGNFPSKIIEGLLHNRIIISTIHYEQIAGIHYIEVPHDKNGFIDTVREWMLRPDNEIIENANQAEEVYKRYNNKEWAKTIQKIEKNAER